MKRERVLCAVSGLLLMGCMGVAAQEKGSWRAESSTAQSITGDVAISGEKIAINFSSFPIARIRSLSPVEISAIFDAESGTGGLYRLSIPAEKRFLHRNTLCGSEETQWMATLASGKTLQLAFFSGATPPVFTPDAIANSTNLCGTYSYGR